MVNLMHMHLLNEYDLLHSLGKWKREREREIASDRRPFFLLVLSFVFIIDANARLLLIESSRAGCDLT